MTLEKIEAMTTELMTMDYQGADSEQHLLAAEALLTVHGGWCQLLANEEAVEPDWERLQVLLHRADLHVKLANARST